MGFKIYNINYDQVSYNHIDGKMIKVGDRILSSNYLQILKVLSYGDVLKGMDD